MAQQAILLGTAPTGVGGDTPRSAFSKAQSNFDEVYAALGATGSPLALPTALPVAKGGTGGTTQASARTGLGLGSAAVASIIGFVGQSGGVPTGAIIERGNNANGDYTRFADGTQICFKAVGVNSTGSYAVASGLFGSDAYGNGAYPAAFASTPFVIASGVRNGGAASPLSLASCYTAQSQTSWGSWRVLAGDNATVGGTLFLIAIGRWF